ncbi:MAG: dephospho-CoA kinase [Clostridia bacterium]|nr:dephospho-CoA kinase [Clostridia bacterium]
MNRYVIGITGGIACGKTNLTDALKELGANVIDADEVSRALTAPGGDALIPIRTVFGDGVFRDGDLDRRALGSIVFSDPDKKKLLEDILHPMIRNRIAFLLDRAEGIVFLSAPLLFECGYEKICDEVWCVYVPQKEQLRRLMARDRLTRAEALKRIGSQWPALRKARLSDVVIRTDGTPEESKEKVTGLYRDRKETRLAERSLQ